MHSIKISSIETKYSSADKLDMLFVQCEVYRDGVFIDSKYFIYGLSTTEECILAEMEKMKSSLDSDYELSLKDAEHRKEIDNAENLKQSLIGKII